MQRFCAITCITVTVLLTLLTCILLSLFKSVPFIASGSYEIPNPNRGNLPFRWCLRFCCCKNHHSQRNMWENCLFTYVPWSQYIEWSQGLILYTKDKPDEKEIRETTPFTIVTNNMKYLGVTLTKKVKDEERNQRGFQKMERSPMLIDWKDQYSKNGYLTKSNLQIQWNPHQNSNSILHWVRKGQFTNSSGITKNLR